MHEKPMWFSWVLLIFGILYLLKDLGFAWMNWWVFNWWTALLVLFGISALCKKK